MIHRCCPTCRLRLVETAGVDVGDCPECRTELLDLTAAQAVGYARHEKNVDRDRLTAIIAARLDLPRPGSGAGPSR